MKISALCFGVLAMTLAVSSCSKHTNPQPPVASADTPNLSKGLVVYLPFNGSFADSSGNNNTVTAVGGPTLDYDMHGYAQSAFNSPVDGARLVVSNDHAVRFDTAFSVSCDFMIRSNAYYNGGSDFHGLEVFLSIVNPATGKGPTFNFGLTLPNAPQYFTFGIQGSQGADCNSFGGGLPGNISDTTNFTPHVGSWYNAICIFTRNKTSVYINGKLISTSTNPVTTSALFCPDSKFVIGGWWDGGSSGSETIRGQLDEVRFYNRTLTATEVTYLARNFQLNSTRVTPDVKNRSINP